MCTNKYICTINDYRLTAYYVIHAVIYLYMALI